ncbi:LLM class flavin-dependent oxidoreductase [Nocardia terpenica]|uniref:LLM class flavin-dependent oxidoreductase n=1 Tax=Nocardia terpenica TaxID=455432 RepID=A0A6G9Z4S7_9NOCA|nr:LLM class flavin-dependent oxidoreductase [Nocardia terpenica]QIS20013.1 LLM class flavin-dependent oxidoreductase [Nocardia terpenica]
MRFAISIPQIFDDGEFDPDAFRAYVRRIEELGFHSGWTQEQALQINRMPQLSALEIMTYAAAVTEHLRLGCSVFVSTLHSPVHLAQAVSSLDQISRGRVEVGIGSGGPGRAFAAFGIDPEGYISRFTEGLEVMRRLWSEPSVTFEGRFWQLTDARAAARPFQKPGPPVWFGGGHPKALRRAARLADGFFGAGSSTTAAFADQVALLRTELAAAGRDASFGIAKRVYIAIDENPDRARRRIAASLEKLYGTPILADVAVTGTVSDCVRGIREVIDAGAELLLFTPLFDDREHLERIAAEVIPQLR